MVNNETALDRTFGALSDPTRRAILSQLQGGGRATVSELARQFPVSLPAVSKHLKVLEEAGLIHRTVQGRVHHLTIRSEPLLQIADWVSHYRQFWSNRLVALEQELVGRPAARKVKPKRRKK